MATWTDITTAALEPGKPVRSINGLALRDNPIAIAEGAAGAPRIVNAAVTNATLGAEKFQSGVAERDWVMGFNVSAGAGGVGTYAFAKKTSMYPAVKALGSTIAGSSLRPSSAGSRTGGSLAGTWRCMGYADTDGAGSSDVTSWLRIV